MKIPYHAFQQIEIWILEKRSNGRPFFGDPQLDCVDVEKVRQFMVRAITRAGIRDGAKAGIKIGTQLRVQMKVGMMRRDFY